MQPSGHGPAVPAIAVDLRALVGVPTGIGVFTESLLRELAGREGSRFVGMSHRPLADAAPLERAGVTLESHGGPLGVIWQQWMLPQRLGRGDIHLLWSPITTLPLRLPIPAVVTIHDLTTLLHPRTHRLKVRLSVLPFLSSTVRRADRIAVDSHSTAQDLRRHFPGCAPRVEVVYPGIDPEFRPGIPQEIEATRHELGSPGGYLLYAGTLEPRKNLATLLDAWETLSSERPDVPPLILVGPYGWRSLDLLRRIEGLSGQGLHYLGRVARARLIRLMQAASIFIYPSLYEGFGLPAAEAMACGVPTIASDRSSLPEVVGDAGLLVDPAVPTSLKEAIASLLDSPTLATELGNRGWRRAQRFSWSSAAARMEGLFADALADHRRRAGGRPAAR